MSRRVPTLMIQGTGSDVGKSIVVAGLGRAFARRGLRVRPFKSQNMSNNAAVTPDGGEIGRAQAVQARACGVAPSVDMNPVLLKPETDRRAQIVVHGRVLESRGAHEYGALRDRLLGASLESFARIGEGADLVLVEGAGSASEINLRARDIANMGFAEAADVPVILLGDIDRGGVIASLVGTFAVLSEAERARTRGFVVNKFRGDPTLFADGLAEIEKRTGWPALGLVPYISAARALPAEDSLPLESVGAAASAPVRVAVPLLSRIANFDDFDPLRAEPDVSLTFVPPGSALPGDADLVVLPGSKSTLADLVFFRAQGWHVDLAAHHRRGGHILGICAGYQMLGQTLRDPDRIEGGPTDLPGLGYLEVETRMEPGKTLRNVSGTELASAAVVSGYEMHLGRMTGAGLARPWLDLAGAPEGSVSSDGRVRGTSLHRLFDSDAFRQAFLARIRPGARATLDWDRRIEQMLDATADALESAIDLERLLQIARSWGTSATDTRD